MKKIIFVLSMAAGLLLTSCDMFNTEGGGEESEVAKAEFLESAELYGVYSGEKPLCEYSEDIHQWSVSLTPTYQFRLQTDTQDQYLVVEMPALPTTTSSVVNVSVTSQGLSALSGVSAMVMEVVKSSSSEVWLWSEDKEIGIVVSK